MYFSHDNQKQVIVKWQQYYVRVSHFANILIHLKSHFLINKHRIKLKYDLKIKYLVVKYATIDGLLCII